MFISKQICPKNYYHFLNKNKNNVSIYQQSNWKDLTEKSFSVSLYVIGTFDKNEKLLCVTPYFKLKRFNISFYGSPLRGLFTMHAGSVFTNDLDRNTKYEILLSQHKLLKKYSHYIEYGITYKSKNYEVLNNLFNNNNYQLESKPTLIINLQEGKDKIWQNLESRARNMVRKSEKNNVTIKKEEIDDHNLKQFYMMLEGTYKRQKKKTPHPLIFYLNLKNCLNSDDIIFLSAKKNNKIIAQAIFIIDHKELFFLSGTANEDGMRYAANSAIQWNVILLGIKMNLFTYDLGGLGLDKIDKFKKSFGGKIEYHKRWTYKSFIIKVMEPIINFLMKLHLFNFNLEK